MGKHLSYYICINIVMAYKDTIFGRPIVVLTNEKRNKKKKINSSIFLFIIFSLLVNSVTKNPSKCL